MKLFKLSFLIGLCFFINNISVNAQQCAISNYSISDVCCDGSGGLKVTGTFTIANGSGAYSVGIPDNNLFNPAAQVAVPNNATNGVINFEVTFPSFSFANNGGNGVFITDDNIPGCTGGTAIGSTPTSAAGCTTCVVAPPAVATAPIPTMSQWGLLIFGLLVLNLGVIFLYKKQADFIK